MAYVSKYPYKIRNILLVGGLEHVFFSIQLGKITPTDKTDFHIFQKG